MEVTLNSVKKVLLENRIDDVKKKYPTVDSEIIDFFVADDPSGNQKYLDWMVKAMTHQPTMDEISGLHQRAGLTANEADFSDTLMGRADSIASIVHEFHELLPYMIYMAWDVDAQVDIKIGTTDLYAYKFRDSEMIHHLLFDINQARQRKKVKEKEKAKEKEFKKDTDKIYNDDSWLVVRSKTWESSCYYGAGTKWCTTVKDDPNHFRRETNRNFLIYVLNKNLPPHNALYKVAWQIPYRKNMETVINPQTAEIDFTKLNLWNAVDTNIASHLMTNTNYIEKIPKNVKLSILNYIKKEMDGMYGKMAYVEDPKIQALVEQFMLTEEDVDSIKILPDYVSNYGMPVYQIGSRGTFFSVVNGDDFYEAKRNWAENYVGNFESVLDIMSLRQQERYVIINNVQQLATEYTQNKINDMSDDEIYEEVRKRSKQPIYGDKFKLWNENDLEEYGILSSLLESLADDFKDLESEFSKEEISQTDYSKEHQRLNVEKKELEKDIKKLFDSMKITLHQFYRDLAVEEMEEYPRVWLAENGYWDNGLEPDALIKGIVTIDIDGFILDLTNDVAPDQFSSTGNWYEVDIESDNYFIFPTEM